MHNVTHRNHLSKTQFQTTIVFDKIVKVDSSRHWIADLYVSGKKKNQTKTNQSPNQSQTNLPSITHLARLVRDYCFNGKLQVLFESTFHCNGKPPPDGQIGLLIDKRLWHFKDENLSSI